MRHTNKLRTTLVVVGIGIVLLFVVAAQSLIQKSPTDTVLATQASARQASTEIPEAAKQQVLKTYGKLPLSFESNQGQTDDQVKFLSRGSGYTLFLTSAEAVLALSKPVAVSKDRKKTVVAQKVTDAEDAQATAHTVLRMKLIDANPTPQVAGLEELPGKSNYFIGNDPQKWHTDIPNYAKVKYREVYPGVDLVCYGNQGQFEYDFVIAPDANPKAITLEFEGADKLEIDARGDLVLHTAGGELIQHAPTMYQLIDGTKKTIDGRYVIKGKNQIGFEITDYDAINPLIIDPLLNYSTYVGGISTDQGFGIAVDEDGNAYVTGLTFSTDFPAASPMQGALAGSGDAFVTKLNVAGSALLYSTYLGGSWYDLGRGIAVDAAGNSYVVGETGSTDFPTTPGAFDVSCGTDGTCNFFFPSRLPIPLLRN